MIAGRVASSVAQRQVKYLKPVSAATASGLVAEIYAQVADEMRIVVPPAMLHSPVPDVLAAYWMLMREPLIPTGVVERAAKEAVASAVSVANVCPYCVDMHSVGMYHLSTEHDAEAIVGDRFDEIDDPRIRAVASWARSAHRPDSVEVRQPPFSAAERPELVGVVVSFHYLTRMVNVFLTNLLPPGLPPKAMRRLKRGLSHLLSTTLHDAHHPGRSIGFLPDAPLPPAAEWAAGNDVVAAAAARSYAAFDAAGDRALALPVRELVCARLEAWRGEEPGLGRDWCEELVSGLPVAQRAAGRLALLVAFASYRVDDEVVAEFRRHQPGDRELVEAVAWASFAAARQVGRWHVTGAVNPSQHFG